jgi:hypothetical protein
MLVRINLKPDATPHRRVSLLRLWKKIQVGRPSDQSLRQRSRNDTGQIERNGERFVGVAVVPSLHEDSGKADRVIELSDCSFNSGRSG